MCPATAKLYLETACQGNNALLEEALGFFADHCDLMGQPFMDRPLVNSIVPQWEPEPLESGASIGHYQLIKELGQGGMGRVFLADQFKPIRRKVALKFLQHTLASEITRAYFKKERHVLAHLEHHYIARIYDADVSEGGMPYFAMEFVDGLPLNQFCREHGLDFEARIRLFQKICEGMIYAHQRGIIHRDLKPGNILITQENGEAIPKIIDFGISRVSGEHWETHMFTHHSLIAGTPQYMSPEQAGLVGMAVDSRSDIYALGIMLYELLIETHPLINLIEPEKTAKKRYKMLLQKDIPLPSKKLQELYIQTGRSTFKRKAKRVRGDLDWIILKAMAKQPVKRYATVNELREDLTLFLENKPIFSRPTSAWFRVKKFASRHRLLMGIAGTITATLLIAMLGLSLGLIRAKRAEHAALGETQRFNYTLNLIEEMLASPDPGIKGRDVRAADILQSFGQRESWQTQALPEVRATLHFLIGKTLQSLGDWHNSADHLEQALQLTKTHALSDDHRRLEIALHRHQVRLQLNQTQKLLPTVRADQRTAQQKLGTHHPITLRFYSLLGDVHSAQSDYLAAAAVLDKALAVATPILAADNRELLALKYERACIYSRLGHYQKSHALFKEVAPIMAEKEGRNAVITLHAYQKEALDLIQLNRPAEALQAFAANLPREKEVFGPSHPVPQKTQLGQLIALSMAGQYAKAATLGEHLYLQVVKARGESDKLALQILDGLGRAYLGNFQHHKALATYKKALLQQQANNSEAIATNVTRLNMASTLYELGHYEVALQTATKALNLNQSKLQPNHPYTLGAQRLLADIYGATGDWESAKKLGLSILKADENNLPALRLMARAALFHNEFNHAATYLEAAETLRPTAWETQALRLELEAKEQRFSGLENTFKAWLLKAEARGLIHHHLGQPLLQALTSLPEPGIDAGLIGRFQKLIIDPKNAPSPVHHHTP